LKENNFNHVSFKHRYQLSHIDAELKATIQDNITQEKLKDQEQ
jgi:hypothetical protein